MDSTVPDSILSRMGVPCEIVAIICNFVPINCLGKLVFACKNALKLVPVDLISVLDVRPLDGWGDVLRGLVAVPLSRVDVFKFSHSRYDMTWKKIPTYCTSKLLQIFAPVMLSKLDVEWEEFEKWAFCYNSNLSLHRLFDRFDAIYVSYYNRSIKELPKAPTAPIFNRPGKQVRTLKMLSVPCPFASNPPQLRALGKKCKKIYVDGICNHSACPGGLHAQLSKCWCDQITGRVAKTYKRRFFLQHMTLSSHGPECLPGIFANLHKLEKAEIKLCVRPEDMYKQPVYIWDIVLDKQLYETRKEADLLRQVARGNIPVEDIAHLAEKILSLILSSSFAVGLYEGHYRDEVCPTAMRCVYLKLQELKVRYNAEWMVEVAERLDRIERCLATWWKNSCSVVKDDVKFLRACMKEEVAGALEKVFFSENKIKGEDEIEDSSSSSSYSVYSMDSDQDDQDDDDD